MSDEHMCCFCIEVPNAVRRGDVRECCQCERFALVPNAPPPLPPMQLPRPGQFSDGFAPTYRVDAIGKRLD